MSKSTLIHHFCSTIEVEEDDFYLTLIDSDDEAVRFAIGMIPALCAHLLGIYSKDSSRF